MEEKSERKINYRELQAIAKRLHLPGNLKYHLLLEVIQARKTGKEYIVDKILSEQKLERVRRKQEKLGAREAAYQHLRITEEKKLETTKMKKLGCHNTSPSLPVPDSSTVHWTGQGGFHANNIRSLLSMPVESFQELLKKSREQQQLKNQEHPTDRPFYYSEYQETVGQRYMYPNQSFLQDSFQSTRDDDASIREEFIEDNANKNIFYRPRPDYPDSAAQIEPQTQPSKRTSFQMRDILGQSDPNWCVSYGQSYCMGSSYETNPMAGDVPNIPPYIPEPFIPHYPAFLPGSEHWRNVYEMNQDYNLRFLEYSGFQGVPGPCTEAASSPNSDTVSATDEDPQKDSNNSGDNFEYNSQISSSSHQNYFAPPSSQGNGDYPESPYIPDLPTVIEEVNISEPPLLADRACKMKMCVS